MRVDVVLCTYNGERYLAEQLQSIERQSRRPDRVLAFDDLSTDGTPGVLHEAAERLPLTVSINPQRLGSVANFDRALAQTRAEVVLLCDQDDVWEPHKVERMLAFMHARPDVLLVGSDAQLVDAAGRPLGRRLLESLGGRGAARWSAGEWLQRLLRRNLVTGATVALRRRLLELAAPVPPDHWHDEWLGLLAAALGRIGWIEEPLMSYRLHDANAAGLSGIGALATVRGALSGGRPHFARRARKLDSLLARLGPMSHELPDGQLALIEQARDFWHGRALPAPSRLRRWRHAAHAWRAGHYGRFADGVKSFARDLFF